MIGDRRSGVDGCAVSFIAGVMVTNVWWIVCGFIVK